MAIARRLFLVVLDTKPRAIADRHDPVWDWDYLPISWGRRVAGFFRPSGIHMPAKIFGPSMPEYKRVFNHP